MFGRFNNGATTDAKRRWFVGAVVQIQSKQTIAHSA
jgi:hypothetical protein